MPLTSQIEQFWEIESCPEGMILSNEENAHESHYKRNTCRDQESGRYIVRLSFEENVVDLGESYTTAEKRFYALERSLAKKPNIKAKYVENLQTYEESHHMTEVKNVSTHEGCHLPHHAVIKESNLTTQLRAVCESLAKMTTGLSLNDTLMVPGVYI
ncbi:uncharacterized protein LOC117178712 [Belonocnema kinseyi]|uniref:uncharacterized protein LOC117178712 n=1 Tax=Belonocnema kinseyi TaxID=2817044 RepID=UPI00143D9CA4|nr:uncharacterized protein LOC117178712 [Belonocnema kinseyi]